MRFLGMFYYLLVRAFGKPDQVEEVENGFIETFYFRFGSLVHETSFTFKRREALNG